MGEHRGNWVWPGALAVVIAVVLAGCSSSSSSSTTTTGAGTTAPSTTGGTAPPGGNSPGVTATSINVGAISTLTGSIASDFNGLAPGVQAYFDMVNAQGGINGRKLNLAWNLDDGGQSSQFTQLTHTLIDQDHAFAVMVASYWFTPNYFVETKTPTYGYNVSGNWATAPNLFGAGGNSVQNYAAGVPFYAFAMKQTHSKSIAVISYGPAITSSYDACNTSATVLKQAGYNVSYVDVGAQLGGSFSSAVQRMQQSGTDFVMSCMQESDNITLARDIQQYGLHVTQLWLSGYDRSLLAQYHSLMQGVYLGNNGTVPYEVGTSDPSTYPGMAQYLAAMNKYEPAFTYNGVAVQGWQSAALLADAIKQAGNNLTQANIINITNHFTANSSGGLSTVTNWEMAHTTTTYPTCTGFVKVVGTKFVPVWATGKQVFVCLGKNSSKNPVPVTPPVGTPGT
jgi:ABC-type branched-subunit amino acid transport system substrate-binding protein